MGRGTIHIEALCISILGGIQPAKLNEYIEENSTESGDDGFLSRFQIMVAPDEKHEWELVDKKDDEEALKQVLE